MSAISQNNTGHGVDPEQCSLNMKVDLLNRSIVCCKDYAVLKRRTRKLRVYDGRAEIVGFIHELSDNATIFDSVVVHPTEIRTSISPSSVVELNTTSALANYATEAVLPTEIRTSISPSSVVEQLDTTSALANYATEADVSKPVEPIESFCALSSPVATCRDHQNIVIAVLKRTSTSANEWQQEINDKSAI
uniref:Uncharacterized protein n=1 Tax=Timema douglasi TaxID=61478 RepID=A0A7R8V9G0_TIMDO|nr:unnamed protein product [Timema douglasi]